MALDQLRTAVVLLSALLVLNTFFQSGVQAEPLTMDDIAEMSLEELLKVKITVASLIPEEAIVAGSTTSVFRRVEWENRGVRELYQIFDYEPSVFTYPSLSTGRVVNIRGGTTNFSGARGLATRLDGVPLNTLSYGTALYGRSSWSPATLDTVELLKGPGSVVHGADAFNGVIDLHTAASVESGGSAALAGGLPDYQGANFRGTTNHTEALRTHVALSAARQGSESIDYKFNGVPVGEYRNAYETVTGVLKGEADLSSDLTVTAGIYGNFSDRHDFPGIGTFASEADLVESGRDTQTSNNDFYMFQSSARYQITDGIEFEAKAYHWNSAIDSDIDAFDSTDATPFPEDRIAFGVEDERHGVLTTLKHPFSATSPMQWVFGFSHERSQVIDTQYALQDETTGALLPISPGTDTHTQFGGASRFLNGTFGEVKFQALPNELYFFAGGRFDHYSDFGSEFVPRAGIIYQFDQDSALKFLYGEAFRAPVAAELKGAGSTAGNTKLSPEIIDTYEIVFQQSTSEHNIETVFFYSDWQDGIGFVPSDQNPGFTSVYANIDQSISYGAELKYLEMFHPFKLGGGYSFVTSKQISSAKERYDAFPEHSLFIDTSYSLPSWKTSVQLLQRLYWNMKDATFDTRTELEELGTYWRTDINIRSSIAPSWDVILSVNNLLNRDLYTPSIWGVPDGARENGTSALLQLQYSFEN